MAGGKPFSGKALLPEYSTLGMVDSSNAIGKAIEENGKRGKAIEKRLI